MMKVSSVVKIIKIAMGANSFKAIGFNLSLMAIVQFGTNSINIV
jgi:hypothetical protein